jgi:hypothetical protein
MKMKYVSVKFSMTQGRTYTFHNDEVEDLKEGDEVAVSTQNGWTKAIVVDPDVPKPRFPTKRVINKIEPEEKTDA